MGLKSCVLCLSPNPQDSPTSPISMPGSQGDDDESMGSPPESSSLSSSYGSPGSDLAELRHLKSQFGQQVILHGVQGRGFGVSIYVFRSNFLDNCGPHSRATLTGWLPKNRRCRSTKAPATILTQNLSRIMRRGWPRCGRVGRPAAQWQVGLLQHRLLVL